MAGYEKAFSDIAQEFRSRSRNDRNETPPPSIAGMILGGLLITIGGILFAGGIIGIFLSFTTLPVYSDFVITFFGSCFVTMAGGVLVAPVGYLWGI